MSDATKVTAAEIKSALRHHFAAPGWRVFYEVGNDTGVRVTRHVDAVAVGIWPSTSHEIHGLEIKVSRSDFQKELKHPEKTQPIFQHCDRFSLVCPAGLVKPSELPKTWGMLTYADGKFRKAVGAPRLEPMPPTPGFMAALVRRAGEMDGDIIATAIEKARAVWNEKRDLDIQQAVSLRRDEATREGAEAIKIVALFREILGDDLSAYNAAEFASLIKCIRKSGVVSTWDGLHKLLENIETAGTSLRKAMSESGVEFPEQKAPAPKLRGKA